MIATPVSPGTDAGKSVPGQPGLCNKFESSLNYIKTIFLKVNNKYYCIINKNSSDQEYQ